MSLRSSLVLKPPASEHIDRIRAAATGILAGLHRGEDVAERISSLNAMTGHNYDLSYFQAFHSFISIGEFAMEAALPAPCVVPDITKDELVEIVRLAMTAGWPNDIYYRNLFDSNVPMPGASGLLFYPEDWKAGQDLSKYDPTPQDIVKRATAPGRIIHL